MKQIMRDSSAYYLLGYNSSEAPTDGKFHDIRVRVKRPGVQVRARKGYWALTAGRRGARARAAEAGAAQAGGNRARRRRRAAVASERRPHVDRDLARRERQDAGDLRLGAVAQDAGRAAAGRARARAADGDRARRVAVFQGPRAGVGPDGHFRRAWKQRCIVAWRGCAALAAARDVRRQPGQDAAAPLGRRHGLAGARHRDPRDRRSPT